MNLESLLIAGLELEKRIASDQALRKCFSSLWKDQELSRSKTSSSHSSGSNEKEVEINLPLSEETFSKLVAVAKLTGKTTGQILEACFLEFYKETFEKSPPPESQG